jgi:DNA repair protein RadC
MGTSNRTRRASRARGETVCARAFADYLPEQVSFLPGVPHLDGDGATAAREFAERAYPSSRPERVCDGSGRTQPLPAAAPVCVEREAVAARDSRRASTPSVRACGTAVEPASGDTWLTRYAYVPYRDYTPVLYAHDDSGFCVASPEQVLVQAQHLVERQFHRDGPLVNNPRIIRAMLELKLAAHEQSVFAAFFLTKRLHLIDYVELFNGTTDKVLIHMREITRAALKHHAEAVIAARNDPTGEGTPTLMDLADASKLRWLLGTMDIKLLDYLVVGKKIVSLSERGNL